MRQKELRIALICYGGISLAVYMHGVTKELWKLARASRAFHAGDDAALSASETIYLNLLQSLESTYNLRLRVLPDIVAGASAGGINGVFLAQAIHAGQSLEPVTDLWLSHADVDDLLDPDSRPWSRFTKFWALPLVGFMLRRPGNVVSSSVAPETRHEVRGKLSRLIRSRWFRPPFSGIGFARLLAEALDAMAASPAESPLLPPDHPLDLFVTATDFHGHMEKLRLNSPSLVEESEHRLTLSFTAKTPALGGAPLAPVEELVFAARATASFPGAFPPLQISELDQLAKERSDSWPSRDNFINRVMPAHHRRGAAEDVALIDGSVLNNAPFAEAMTVLQGRPAQREVDRRFVYIDPRPDRGSTPKPNPSHAPGFFSVITGALSSIPREQPIRDNLETLERQSREMARLRGMVTALRPDVDDSVTKLFHRTLFFDRPTPKRLRSWRAKAHAAAVDRAGFAFQGYVQLKFAGVLDDLARLIQHNAPQLQTEAAEDVYQHLIAQLARIGINQNGLNDAGVKSPIAGFFREHDLAFRIRRLRLLIRRLSDDWSSEAGISEGDREQARDVAYKALAIYFDCEASATAGREFANLAEQIASNPAAVLAEIAGRRQLIASDHLVDALLAQAMTAMPPALRRLVLITYLGFPFYDTVTLPLLRGEGLTEFDPVKVDRISPDDATSIRKGGASATLRGVEFYNFGAFFSRSYRENDYLWGRLHGAERMIDLVISTLPATIIFNPDRLKDIKRAAFLAILDEEENHLTMDPKLISGIRAEVMSIS
jgi:patatin-related protein